MAGFTPGPWNWRLFGNGAVLVADYGKRKVILSSAKTCDPSRAESVLHDATGEEPDMVLLAAAPDLMEAMDALMPYLSTEAQLLDNASLNEGTASGFDSASVKARKAVAKAKGFN